jgi:hypothetical protein
MNNFYYEKDAQSERMKKILPEFQKLYNAFNHFQRITTSLCVTINESTKEHFINICSEAEELFLDELLNFMNKDI